ncbi:Rne/Rng family ribonuclease [Labrys wisconsinensis]|uniref:Ribonuclease E n=1 Tax=Labrys wisconsinensis TaxID=425677 RepID=A0ABU0J3L6_9HYPH|nr:ribonuclease E/G [Labrys wisconsinensis]MDQ0468829.1 ribonuclease E [Labrys wisconsinensis]
MANKMLIDAAHPEETRVVVVRGNRVEEFDFESANRKQLRGNIYLAKVTRVEPSLQAAFVEYGGNRHGFLAFSEIHPDYYQIPVADRLALLAEERRAHRDEDEDEENGRGRDRDRRRGRGGKGGAKAEAAEADSGETVSEPAEAGEAADAGETVEAAESGETEVAGTPIDDNATGSGELVEVGTGSDPEHVEALGSGDALEDVPERTQRSRKQYKIQEVIKRRQVLLVQVVKEERGNKGAALTTYLSLAGRYSVLMPNTARGGGISRKITNAVDRKRLKSVASELDVPDGMGVILRTAGAARTKAEIKRDFEYLLRLWENVRDLTLKSSAPTLVYEEGSLIKRSIRDLYNKDIDEVIVAGDEGYREAKEFMRMLMPSHAKNVQGYKDAAPLFQRFGVETQLDAMFSPQVTLKSGGYLVINQTEALVSIDVNSGRSTREHNIEDTALRTNLEAAEEVSRQLRLRDLAGLIVIDFIDMEESRNNRAVERKLKDCLKNDRARIQVGRISHFGLLEMSRQRIRTGVLESSTEVCPHCGGAGHVRSVTSVALHILRALEDQLLRSATHNLLLRTRTGVALYVLNHKRGHLHALEVRFGVTITLNADETIVGNQNYLIERGDLATPVEPKLAPPATTVQVDSLPPIEEAEEIEAEDGDEDEDEEATEAPRRGQQHARAESEGEGRRKRRRRRRRKGSGEHHHAEQPAVAAPNEVEVEAETEAAAEATEEVAIEAVDAAAEAEPEAPKPEAKGRRRGRRGGRRPQDDETIEVIEAADEDASTPAAESPPVEAAPEPAAPEAGKKPRRRGRREVPIAVVQEAETVQEPAAPEIGEPIEAVAVPPAAAAPVPEPAPEPELVPELEPAPAHAPREVVVSNPGAYVYVDAVDPAAPKKAGWWSKR